MPIQCSIDNQEMLVVLEIEGVLDAEELIRALQALWSDPAFEPSMDVLVHVKPGASHSLTSVDLNGVVRAMTEAGARRGTGSTAVVAPADADFGLVRAMSQLLQDASRPLAPFKTEDEARAWLGR